jgi:hypothetical protein
MIAYALVNWVYSGDTVNADGVAPSGYTFVSPINCEDDEVVMLIAGTAVAVKKSSLQQLDSNYEQSIDVARANKIQEIEFRRAELERAGCPFVFGETGDNIQTRDERDFININGVTTSAMLLKTAGVTDAIIIFRAKSDASYQLTPDQAIQLGVAVAARSVELYKTQWELKDAAENAASIEEINAIQWPEN